MGSFTIWPHITMIQFNRKIARGWIFIASVFSSLSLVVILISFSIYKINKINLQLKSTQLDRHLTLLSKQLETPLIEIYRSVLIVSHSLALRRHMIEINQNLIRLTPEDLNSTLHQQDSIWMSAEPDSPDVLTITDSLEAQYLRDVISYSNGLIRSIFVTDVFGSVRIATQKTDKTNYFEDTWWQDSLLVPPGIIYLSEVSPSTPVPANWVWSIPLRTDEGNDCVGVIRVDIRLSQLLERVLISDKDQDVATYIVTQDGAIYPPVSEEITFPSSTFKDDNIIKSGRLDSGSHLFIRGQKFHFKSDDGLQGHDWLLLAVSRMEPIFSIHNRNLQQILFLMIFCGIVIVLTALIIARGSEYPLIQISQLIQAINQGNLKSRLNVQGAGVIGNLYGSINSMLARLIDNMVRAQTELTRQTREKGLLCNFIKTCWMLQDHDEFFDLLLQTSVRHTQSESGIVCLFSDSTQTLQLKAHYSIDTAFSHSLVNLVQTLTPTGSTLLYAWSHAEYQVIWDQNYQVAWITTIASSSRDIGYIILLFKHAPEQNLGTDTLIETLAKTTSLILNDRVQ